MVNKTAVFMRSFLKKSFAQIVALVVLFTFSSLLLNTLLFLQTDYKKNFERTCEKLNTEDVSLIYYNLTDSDRKKQTEAVLDSLDFIADYELDEVISGSGSIEFNGGEMTNVFTVADYEAISEKTIGAYEMLNEIESEGVILSYLFHVSGGYQINDTISFRVNENRYTYKIAGFYNNPTTGTVNCPDTMVLATKKIFDEIRADANPSLRMDIRTKAGEDTEEAINKITAELAEEIPFLLFLYGNDQETIKGNRYSNATLFEVILSAASVVMIAVLLIIIFITLTNYIRNSTRDLGALKAIGFTSGDLVFPIAFEIAALALAASLAGGLLSYLVLPLINTALESQIGIPYHIEFQAFPLVISILAVSLAALITTVISLARIKSIAPIHAIRENKAAVAKTSKIITVDRSNLEINTLIGLKGFVSGIGRNVVILVAITAVSFLAGFTCFMYQNVIQDNNGVIELICGQIADSTLSAEQRNEERLLEELDRNPDVERYYLYTVSSIRPEEHPVLNTYVIEESSYLNAGTIRIDGKLPEKENEVAVNGAYAKENGLQIGDKIAIEAKNGELKLVVSGLTQGAYYTGRDGYILRETYEKIADLHTVSYYIDLKEGADIDVFNDNICDAMPKMITNYVNQDKYLQSTAAMYSSILYVLAAVICLLSILIIAFVLYILIYILLKNKRREHGILKSIGYTSGELIYQTILTILPTCLIAIAVGLYLSKDGVKELLSLALNSIGIFRFGQSIHTLYLVIAGVFLTLFTIVYTLFMSLSIKKISPHDLFNNE